MKGFEFSLKKLWAKIVEIVKKILKSLKKTAVAYMFLMLALMFLAMTFAKIKLLVLSVVMFVGAVALSYGFYVNIKKNILNPIKRNIRELSTGGHISEGGCDEIVSLQAAFAGCSNKATKEMNELAYVTYHDPVTDVFNRAAFNRIIAELDSKKIALAIIDVDNFKEINDGYGHDAGDKALKKVAKALKQNFRQDDYVCRIGGDEFAVIMMNAGEDMGGAVFGKTERINEALVSKKEGEPSISVSIGAARGMNSKTTKDLFKEADFALYKAKRDSEKRCFVSSVEINS